jgi:hypothetical protein
VKNFLFSNVEIYYLLACKISINGEDAVVSSKNVLEEITKIW